MNRNYVAPLARLLSTSLACLALQPVALVSANMLSPAVPQNAATIDAQEQSRQQERERALQQQNTPKTAVRLTRPTVALPDYPTNESPCFPINTFTLAGDEASRFQWALEAVSGAKGRCLGSQGILLVINKVQNAILEQGYVTTRVMAQEQDLTKGGFTLTLQPGRIANIHFAEPVSYRARLWNAVPARSGDILNLRDIEQALENFKRVPNVEADIKIVPGAREATSDLLITWKESRPFHLSLGLDDSGSESTGKYQGSTTLSIDAPFTQNDLFYVNLGRSLFRDGPYDSRSHTVNYTLPVGYWSFSANYNDYNYHQNIANANEILSYSGKSENAQFTASRLLFRNQVHKTTLNMRVYRRHSTNAVDGIEIEQQQRRTAGWELGLNQHSYLGDATLDANINWRRGTGAFDSLPAPEETYNGGTSRPSLVTGDITLTARDILEHHGKLYSGGQLSVQSRQGEIKQSGTLAAAGNVTLQAAQAIQSSGHLLAGSDANSTLIRPADLTLESQADIRASGSLTSQSKASVTGRKVDVSQSRVAAKQAVLTAQTGDVALQQAQIDSQQFTVNSQGNVYAQQAQIRAGSWQITADSLFNQMGIWSQVGPGESRFTLTGALDNTDGSIEAQQLSLNSATLNNLRGRLVALDGTAQHWRVSGLLANQSGIVGSNGSLQLDLGALDNQQGTLQSQSHLALTLQQGADNRQGKLLSGGNLTLNSLGTLNNSAGEIRGQTCNLLHRR